MKARPPAVPVSRLHVRVSPGARRAAVVGRHGAGWRLRVVAPPEAGRANAEVVELLASALELPVRDVELVTGARGRDKIVEIRGLDADEAERRLESAR